LTTPQSILIQSASTNLIPMFNPLPQLTLRINQHFRKNSGKCIWTRQSIHRATPTSAASTQEFGTDSF